MDITEVRVKLMSDKSEKLQAFCSVTIGNDFVIRDLKIIEGTSGPFVAMPSRKLADRCQKCGCKNHLRANFCNECGNRLKDNRGGKDDKGRAKLHADIAHPINSRCREELQKKVLAAYQEEVERSRQEGYVPPKYDDFEEHEVEYEESEDVRPAAPKAAAPQKEPPVEKPKPRPAPAEPQPHVEELDEELDTSFDNTPRPREKKMDDFESGIFT